MSQSIRQSPKPNPKRVIHMVAGIQALLQTCWRLCCGCLHRSQGYKPCPGIYAGYSRLNETVGPRQERNKPVSRRKEPCPVTCLRYKFSPMSATV